MGRSRARAFRLVVRVLPALRRRDARPPAVGHVCDRGEAAAGDRRDGLRRRLHPAGASDRDDVSQRSEQHPDPGARRSRRPVGDRIKRGWARCDPPRPRHDGRLRRVRRCGEEQRPRDRARPRAAVLARPSVGDRASGVVHHPRRRQHRLRREPAEEVPGHLPAELRQRLRAASTPRLCGSCACG